MELSTNREFFTLNILFSFFSTVSSFLLDVNGLKLSLLFIILSFSSFFSSSGPSIGVSASLLLVKNLKSFFFSFFLASSPNKFPPNKVLLLLSVLDFKNILLLVSKNPPSFFSSFFSLFLFSSKDNPNPLFSFSFFDLSPNRVFGISLFGKKKLLLLPMFLLKMLEPVSNKEPPRFFFFCIVFIFIVIICFILIC